MPYRYLEDVAVADVALLAWGETIEEMFLAAADGTLGVMIEDPTSLLGHERRVLQLEDSSLDMLLLQFLQELIFFKDAQRLLLRVKELQIREHDGQFSLLADAAGEEINPARHKLIMDLKAVTLYRLRVEKTMRGWEATVILDV
jgi:SHS2 domain-containing protein